MDYEIISYRVYWKRAYFGNAERWYSRKFNTEEDAIQFVKDFRMNWKAYRLEQIRSMIIDF